MTEASMTATNQCPRCAAAFTCGMQAGESACWCAAFPSAFAIPAAGAVDPAAACYCPRCLAELIEQKRAKGAGAKGEGAATR